MPGCTVPNCTNSSQKGFKLYHFPSDKERNSTWVQNCGRERGWIPTKHTCVCEVHFEESQFESHRADGLRKLKPNAVPTVFTNVAPLRSYTRKPKKELKIENVDSATVKSEDVCEQNAYSKFAKRCKQEELGGSTAEDGDSLVEKETEDLKEPDHTYQKFSSEDEKEANKDATSEPGEVFVNVSLQSQNISVTKISVRGRKRGRPPGKRGKKDDACDWSPDKPKTDQVRKRGRPPGSANKTQRLPSSPVRKSPKVSTRSRNKLQETDEGTTEQDCPTSDDKRAVLDNEEKECFVCGKMVKTGVALHTVTNTTKVYLHQKLDKIITGEMELLIDEDGILCTRCSTLLNYMDRIEVELNMLTKAILNCIHKKYGMGTRPADKGSENLLRSIENAPESTGEMVDIDLQPTPRNDSGSQWINYEDNTAVPTSSIKEDTEVTKSEDDVKQLEEIQCRVCRFRTCYKSLMIFHLRQHLRDTYQCDFCNVALPGLTTWVKGDSDQGSPTGDLVPDVDLGDEHVATHVEVAQIAEETDDGITKVTNETDDTGMLPDSTDVLITVIPVDSKDKHKMVMTVSQQLQEQTEIEGAIPFPDQNTNESVDENSSHLPRLQSISNDGKRIRVLNELGMIVTQEVGTDGNGKDIRIGKMVLEDSTSSQFLFETGETVPQMLGDGSTNPDARKCPDGNTLELVPARSKELRILNDMGIIEVAPVESTEHLLANSDMNEMKVNVTPGMMTYSNIDRKLNLALVHNSSELNEHVFQR